jgi:hypothetical protein
VLDSLDVGRVDAAYAYRLYRLPLFTSIEVPEDLADTVYADDVFGVLFCVCGVESADA